MTTFLIAWVVALGFITGGIYVILKGYQKRAMEEEESWKDLMNGTEDFEDQLRK